MIRIPIVSEFKDAGFKDAQKATQSLSDQMKGLAKTAGLAFSAGVIVDFGKKAVSAAIDLNESINAVNVTFGQSSEAVLKLSDDAARSVGLSKEAFNSLSVEIAGFAQQLAGEGQDVSEVIDDMTTRAADFASVMNISVDEAVGVFQSTLAGSSEVIRKYGVDVSAAAVEQYLLGEGIAESKSEITEAMKVQARYQLIMEGTAKTAGDFANTSDSLANQQRILTAELQNMTAELGQQALPLLGDLADVALEAADAIMYLDEQTAKLPGSGGLFDALGSGLKIITQGWQDYTMDLLEAGEAEREAAKALGPTNAMMKLRADAFNTVHRQAVRALRAEALATEEAARAQQEYLESIRHTRDEAAALARQLSDRRDLLGMQDAFDQFRTTLDDTSLSAREQEQALIDLKLELIDYAEQLDLPDAVVTQIIAELDAGGIDDVQAFISRLGNGITLPITPQVIRTGSNTAVRVDEFGNLRSIPAMAKGGIVTGPTIAMIGEAGPEAVVPLNKTGQLGSSFNITVNAGVGSDGASIGREIVNSIKAYERVNGRNWRQ